MKPESLSSFFIITQTLLNHVVTADLQIYRIECMHNLEPHCCEVQCGLQLDDITEEGQCDVSGNHMTCVFHSRKTRTLSTPSELRKIASAARCNIYKTEGFSSCYHDGKPICCDTPCECDLNLLNATCTIQDKSMECSCAGTASADDPVLHSCFKNLHKTTSRACDIKAGDTCYISTGATDGNGQEQKSEQVSNEDKKERKDNNVTPKPDNQPSANNNAFWIGISSFISGIGGIVLGILLSWLCCYLNRKCSICGSCCENQKKLDHKRKECSLEDKDKESKSKDDEEDPEEMKREHRPCLPQHKKLDRVRFMRHRISSTSSSESEPGSVKM